jgi:hypothetical protein
MPVKKLYNIGHRQESWLNQKYWLKVAIFNQVNQTSLFFQTTNYGIKSFKALSRHGQIHKQAENLQFLKEI